jgi:hypothetical protein
VEGGYGKSLSSYRQVLLEYHENLGDVRLLERAHSMGETKPEDRETSGYGVRIHREKCRARGRILGTMRFSD